jgi:hypothetical protein
LKVKMKKRSHKEERTGAVSDCILPLATQDGRDNLEWHGQARRGSIRHHAAGRPADVNDKPEIQTSPPLHLLNSGSSFHHKLPIIPVWECFDWTRCRPPLYEGDIGGIEREDEKKKPQIRHNRPGP